MREIYIASDHAGFDLKALIIKAFDGKNDISFKDLGTDNGETSVDYPDFAKKLIDAVSKNQNSSGILICGTGIGMSISANRNPKIRAALCHNVEYAHLAVAHNNANVLVLGGRNLEDADAINIADAYLSAEFEGGRHQRRIDKL